MQELTKNTVKKYIMFLLRFDAWKRRHLVVNCVYFLGHSKWNEMKWNGSRPKYWLLVKGAEKRTNKHNPLNTFFVPDILILLRKKKYFNEENRKQNFTWIGWQTACWKRTRETRRYAREGSWSHDGMLQSLCQWQVGWVMKGWYQISYFYLGATCLFVWFK